MVQIVNSLYIVMRGPADVFRGDWYDQRVEFMDLEEAIQNAFDKTLSNYLRFLQSWEEFGYEWSVFEIDVNNSTKIWEGFKCIRLNLDKKRVDFDIDEGRL
jgi:hypothetical protein